MQQQLTSSKSHIGFSHDKNRSRIQEELISILFQNAVVPNVANLVGAAAIWYLFSSQFSTTFLFNWCLYMSSIVFIRLYIYDLHKKEKYTIDKLRLLRNLYIIGTGLVSLGWAFIAYHGLTLPEMEYRIYIVLMVVSLLGSAVPVLAASTPAVFAHIVPSLLVVICLLISHGGKELAMAIALAIYAFGVLRAGLNLNKTLHSSITLRLHNQAISEGLEKTVSERTVELSHSRDIAEKANRAKSEFLANMSHEIRTPMNSIIHFSKLAMKEDMSPRSRDFIHKVSSASHGLLRIINDILDFSKIESGKVSLEEEVFSMDSMLMEVTESFQNSAEEKGLKLNVIGLLESDVILKGDSLRIQQVLNNLISNAIKFTDHGEVKVEVREGERLEGKTQLIFRVIDTGIGITEEQQKKLFQPFQQADTSTTRQFGGTGLGLVICKQLIELMGGEISCSSSYGEGSVFTFTLSFDCVEEVFCDVEAAEEREGNELQAALGRISGSSILVVEDNSANQFIVQTVLENSGLSVEVAQNGLEALEFLAKSSYDLVFMDIQMPVLDGYEATKEIRKNPQFRELPIIAMTANAMTEDRQKCLEIGMNAHLSKPLDMDHLFRLLVEWIPVSVDEQKTKITEHC